MNLQVMQLRRHLQFIKKGAPDEAHQKHQRHQEEEALEKTPPSHHEDKQEEAILVIRDGLVKHTTCADPEINLSATMINLQLLAK